jgi:hypothetical protein
LFKPVAAPDNHLHTNKAELPLPRAMVGISLMARLGDRSPSTPRCAANDMMPVPSLSFCVQSALATGVFAQLHFAVANGFARASLAPRLPPAVCKSSISNRLTSLKSVEIVVCIQMKFRRECPASCNDNDRRHATMGE